MRSLGWIFMPGLYLKRGPAFFSAGWVVLLNHGSGGRQSSPDSHSTDSTMTQAASRSRASS
jgi:hypothetical protein